MTSVGSPQARSTLVEGLQRALSDSLGPVKVVGLTRLKGGYSRETWSFDARREDLTRVGLILCADQTTGVVGRDGESLDRVTEGQLLARLHARGLAVPAVYATGNADGALGRPFLVMARAQGTTAVGPIIRDRAYDGRRHALAEQQAAILASIHAARSVALDLLADTGPPDGDCASHEVKRWSAALAATAGARTLPVVRGLDWLERQLPVPTTTETLVHGDYRMGNLVYGLDGIRSVLDWEMAHIGDPLEDIAWAQLVCWRLGTTRVGGLVEPDEWIRLYERASGTTVDRRRLRFWDVLSAVKMACLAWRAVEATTAGSERDLLGRLFRQLETELEQTT